MRILSAGILVAVIAVFSLLGQSAQPTDNALTRTFMVQTANERGTIFSIDIDNREYWITAKHLLSGAEHPPYGVINEKSATVSILNPGLKGQQWLPVTFSVIDPGKDIDIVVLAPPHSLLDRPLPLKANSMGIGMGAECEFLGFPYGGGWRARFANGSSVWFPYAKHCFVSALVEDGSKVWVLDGINNAGFSGGPVLYGTGSQQKVFAVISGYYTEPLQVIPDEVTPIPIPPGAPPQERETVRGNSGFIIAFDIQPAIDAIRKHPIGPLRNP